MPAYNRIVSTPNPIIFLYVHVYNYENVAINRQSNLRYLFSSKLHSKMSKHENSLLRHMTVKQPYNKPGYDEITSLPITKHKTFARKKDYMLDIIFIRFIYNIHKNI